MQQPVNSSQLLHKLDQRRCRHDAKQKRIPPIGKAGGYE